MYKGKQYEFEGEMLSIKMIAGKVELAPSTLYKYLNQGFSLYDAIEEGKKKSEVVFKNKPKTNNRLAKKYPYLDGMYTVSEVATMEEISEEPIYRRLNSGMTMKEAVESIKKNIAKKYPFKGGFYSVYKISLVTGVPKSFLSQKLDPDKEYEEKEIEKIVSSYTRNVLMVGDITLFQYCLQNQYNYSAIFHAIKEKGYTPEEAISNYLNNKKDFIMVGDISLSDFCIQNQYNYDSIYYSMKVKGYPLEDAVKHYIEEGQGNINSYSFLAGDILLSHFCIKERLDVRYILDRIRKKDTIEEAITACIFLSKEDYATRDIRNKLYAGYKQLGYEGMMQQDLSDEHKDYLTKKHHKTLDILKKYRLYQALSLLTSDLSKEDRALVLERLSLTEEDLWNCEEELFDGFSEREMSVHGFNSVSYVWDIGSKKTKY